MKKRKTALLGFLLTAMLGIGVGYAAVTDVLDVTGKVEITEQAAAGQFDTDVYFLDDITISKPTVATASINTNDKDKASFTVSGLNPTVENDTVTITYTVKNDSTRDVQIAVKYRTNYSDATTGTYTSADNCFIVTNSIGATTPEIAAGGTLDIIFTVTLTQTPTTTIDESFIIEFEATALADNA